MIFPTYVSLVYPVNVLFLLYNLICCLLKQFKGVCLKIFMHHSQNTFMNIINHFWTFETKKISKILQDVIIFYPNTRTYIPVSAEGGLFILINANKQESFLGIFVSLPSQEQSPGSLENTCIQAFHL